MARVCYIVDDNILCCWRWGPVDALNSKWHPLGTHLLNTEHSALLFLTVVTIVGLRCLLSRLDVIKALANLLCINVSTRWEKNPRWYLSLLSIYIMSDVLLIRIHLCLMRFMHVEWVGCYQTYRDVTRLPLVYSGSLSLSLSCRFRVVQDSIKMLFQTEKREK